MVVELDLPAPFAAVVGVPPALATPLSEALRIAGLLLVIGAFGATLALDVTAANDLQPTPQEKKLLQTKKPSPI